MLSVVIFPQTWKMNQDSEAKGIMHELMPLLDILAFPSGMAAFFHFPK